MAHEGNWLPPSTATEEIGRYATISSVAVDGGNQFPSCAIALRVRDFLMCWRVSGNCLQYEEEAEEEEEEGGGGELIRSYP